MRTDFRYDSAGRPKGLVWPEPPPEPVEPKPKPEPVAKKKTPRKGNGGAGGSRPPQEYCNKGLHKLSEHGGQLYKTDKATGKKKKAGRYCKPCALERKHRREAEKNANGS